MKVIHLLRKPISEGSVAANSLKHGTGGLNIDASRITTSDSLNGGAYAEDPSERHDGTENWRYKRGQAGDYQQPSGRWPANVILQHLDGCRCDGVKRVKSHNPDNKTVVGGASTGECYGDYGKRSLVGHADKDGKETIANWTCEDGCPVKELDNQSGIVPTGSWIRPDNAHKFYLNKDKASQEHQEWKSVEEPEGGASRFFKQVK